jgi:hypothetical protein
VKQQYKVLLCIVVVFFGLTSFGPLLAEETNSTDKPSIFQKTKKWFRGNSSSNKKKIRKLQEEIQMREKVLADMDKFMTNAASNAKPRCAGGTVTVSFPDDPRDEIRTEIFELRKKIKKLRN